jgi:uncharacterized protein YqjF (DUF2071 family)
MLNYCVAPEMLEPFVPRGTELDLWEGKAFVSAVGFLFERIRVLGIPVLTHRLFEEVNLRFYVRRTVSGVARHGVTFIRELVPRRLVSVAAKLTYNEPYRRVDMFHKLDVNQGEKRAAFEWRSGASYATLWVESQGSGELVSPGTFEDFLTHREWGYTRQRDGATVEYRVDHPRWTFWRAADAQCAGPALAASFGDAFAAEMSRGQHSAWLSDGSAVVVHRPVRI